MPHKQRFYTGIEFVISTPGVLKIVSLLLFFTSSVIFLVIPICGGGSSWSDRLYPISGIVSGVGIILMYMVFATGFAKRNYAMWTLIDMIFNMMDFTFMLMVSIITLSHCSGSNTLLRMVPAPMGIIGALLLATTSAVWFAQNRDQKEYSVPEVINHRLPHFYRKSITV